MPKLNRQLRQLTHELAGVQISTPKGTGEIDELKALANGDLEVHLKTGRTLTVPRVASFLTPTILKGAVHITRGMSQRGLIGSAIGFLKFVAFLILLTVIGVIVLIILGIRALFNRGNKVETEVGKREITPTDVLISDLAKKHH